MTQTKDRIRVAAVQAKPPDLSPPLDLLSGNLDHAFKLMEQAREMDVDIACFPEFFPGHGEKELCQKAKELGLHVIVWLPERSNNKIYSTSVLISSEGEVIGRQRKFHLDWAKEKIFEPGTENLVFDTKFGVKVGIAVCVDGWGWPEQTTDLALKGADIIFNPLYGISATQLQQNAAVIRAHDNFIPIVFVRSAGHRLQFGDVLFENAGNGSMIICPPFPVKGPEAIAKIYPDKGDPWGPWIVKKAADGETILTADLEPALYRQGRKYWLEERRKLKMS